MWIPQNLTNENSTLVQVMAWCCQATRHYLSQCWPRTLSLYSINELIKCNQLHNITVITVVRWKLTLISKIQDAPEDFQACWPPNRLYPPSLEGTWRRRLAPRWHPTWSAGNTLATWSWAFQANPWPCFWRFLTHRFGAVMQDSLGGMIYRKYCRTKLIKSSHWFMWCFGAIR